MEFRVFGGSGLLRPPTPLAAGPSEDATTTAPEEMSYSGLAAKMIKSPLPLILLVVFRYLLEYAVHISFYLIWLMMYHNLSSDFANHLIFRNGNPNSLCQLSREFLRFDGEIIAAINLIN